MADQQDALRAFPESLRGPIQVLREKLANDETGWRALLPVMEALAASAPHEACAHDRRHLTVEGFQCIECGDTKRQIAVPHSWDVTALELACRFTQDTEPQRRASLQCAVLDAMRFAAPATHEAQQSGGEVVGYIWPSAVSELREWREQNAPSRCVSLWSHPTGQAGLPVYLAPPSPDTAALVALRKIVAEADKNPFNPIGHVIEHAAPEARSASETAQ